MNALVLVPYTDLRPETAMALCRSGLLWDPVPLDPADEESYHRLLAERWAEGKTFVVIEQDIVVRLHTVTNLLRCPEGWCAYPYPYFVGEYAGLGCTKFSGGLIGRHPDLFEAILALRYPPPHENAKHWCTQDNSIKIILGRRGEFMHIHQPAVGHVREAADLPQPTHGCH